ncbi:MAG: hypothetical protein DRQ55_16205 [Planctomycetota bacterium]|nr:MAG: hypothetical protein DRQ55_16205 [Planctomycetota bacterium]
MSPPTHQVISRFSVRSYETDSYRHLNNGVYLSWLEHGRLEYLQSLGFSYDGLFARDQGIVVARTEVDFRAPLQMNDTVELTSCIEGFGRTSCRFRQVMRLAPEHPQAGRVACEGLTIMVFAGPDGPVPVPDDVRRAVETGTPA